jgi:gamma-glutamyl-gamma-aminobutyrate hydrolase PuuD
VASNGSETPRIGLTTYVEHAQFGPWERESALLPSAYVNAVGRAGGIPLMLPPVALDDAAARVVESLDGLLLTGGPDVGDDAARDTWELALLDAALARDLPVLAICRGLQLLDVACGGTLHAHVPDVVGHKGHRPKGGEYGTTHVKITPDSKVAALLGDAVDVPCHHHQSIDQLGAGLAVVGAAEDGIVEAIEARDRGFVIGVQWHPEDGDDPRLFDAFIAAARA